MPGVKAVAGGRVFRSATVASVGQGIRIVGDERALLGVLNTVGGKGVLKGD